MRATRFKASGRSRRLSLLAAGESSRRSRPPPGYIEAVLEVLSADVVRRADRHAIPADRPSIVQGVQAVAKEIAVFGRSTRFAELLLVNGSVGIAVAPYGRLRLIIVFVFASDKITEYELVANPARLEWFQLATLTDTAPAG